VYSKHQIVDKQKKSHLTLISLHFFFVSYFVTADSDGADYRTLKVLWKLRRIIKNNFKIWQACFIIRNEKYFAFKDFIVRDTMIYSRSKKQKTKKTTTILIQE
jgi:hypothetical protein